MAKKAKKTKETIEIKETANVVFVIRFTKILVTILWVIGKRKKKKKAMVNSSVVVMNVTKPNFFLR